MENIPDKSDSTAGASGQLPASQYNDHKNEIQGVITKSGQTLNPAITDQFPKAIFINAIGASSMVDSGSGNAITLQPQTGGSGLVPPGDYADFDGGVVCFNKATANTATAVTIAPWGLTAKTLVRNDGSVPYAGDVKGICFAKWDNSGNQWILLRNETDSYKYLISASGAVAPKFTNNEIEVDLSLGNVNISVLPVPDFIGQRVHIYGVGSGIGSIAGGTGLYTNGVFFTENTGGVFLTAVSLTEWRAENGVTADYVNGSYKIEQYSDGRAKEIFTTGVLLTNTLQSSPIYVSPIHTIVNLILFTIIDKISHNSSGITGAGVWSGNTTTQNLVRLFSTSSTYQGQMRITTEGKY